MVDTYGHFLDAEAMRPWAEGDETGRRLARVRRDMIFCGHRCLCRDRRRK